MSPELLCTDSIGIIGGADGPTAVFVAVPDGWWQLPAIAAAVAAIAVLVLVIRKRKGR